MLGAPARLLHFLWQEALQRESTGLLHIVGQRMREKRRIPDEVIIISSPLAANASGSGSKPTAGTYMPTSLSRAHEVPEQISRLGPPRQKRAAGAQGCKVWS